MFGIDDPGRQRAVLGALLVVGTGVVFIQSVYAPIRDEREATERRLAGLARLNREARALTQPRRVRELERKEAEFELVLAEVEARLASEAEVAALLTEVSAAALAERIQVVHFAPRAELAGEHLVEFPFDLQIQGGYHDLGRFLARIVNLERVVQPSIVSLEAVEILADDGTAAHEVLATLVLSTYVPASALEVPPPSDTALRPGRGVQRAQPREVDRAG